MDLTPMFVGLGVLAAIFLIIYVGATARTWKWGKGSEEPTLSG